MSRITGLATGLDVDAVVEETMNAYQTKIDAVDQQKMLAEIQQEMYREVITECRDFYDKYFDISKSDSILLQKNWSSVSFESSNSSVVTATASGGAEVDGYDVQVLSLAEAAKLTIYDTDLETMDGISITVKDENNKDKQIVIDLSSVKDNSEKVTIINNRLNDYGITAKYSSFSGGISISTKENGSEQTLEVKYVNLKKDAEGKVETDEDGNVIVVSEVGSVKAEGTDCVVKLTNSKGEIYNYKGKTNNLTLDGVNFKFSSVNVSGSIKNGEYEKDDKGNYITDSVTGVTLTGKTNVTEIKDKIVKFVNDYNSLMEKLNTLINEKRDSDYMPLTDAQKEEMTEKQIELWEKKVKTGQLSRDSDLTRIRNAMKTAMSSLTNSLASFGIKPVSDYGGNKNGTFTIDEDALTKALENNMDDVMKAFISNEENNKGVAQQLKTLFDKETQSSSGSLLKKAGMEGSSTASNNTLSKKIAKYEEKITRMQSIFASKQQALYSKYARLETLMNNLNSQQSYLTSMFYS